MLCTQGPRRVIHDDKEDVRGVDDGVVSILATGSYAPRELSFKRSTRLERVDQFSRLNPTNCTTHAKQSFINHAPILTQIDEARPTYVYPDDAGRFMTTAGMVSPEDRHFVVADSVHTIAQFRVMDFDYEDCQVVIEVPSQDVLDTVWSKSISLSHDIVGVDIWRLADDSEFVDPRTLSWKTRPRRVDQSPLVTLDIAIGASVVSQRFPCKQDAVIGLELTRQNGVPLIAYHAKIHVAVNRSRSTRCFHRDQRSHDAGISINALHIPAHTIAAIYLFASLLVLFSLYVLSSIADFLLPYLVDAPEPTVLVDLRRSKPVKFYIQNTARYDVDTPLGAEDFAGLFPSSGHAVRIPRPGKKGSEADTYTVALFHQLRCLEILRNDYYAMGQPNATSEFHRLHDHCIGYLRQSVLCLADTRLESVRSPLASTAVSFEGDYICRDWRKVYEAAENTASSERPLGR
ncbi:hypothetical protein EIP91_010894 [Steccherinum ochraceum]|uniref:Ubiquitin 3 binding protein But2 C-terminal domain-containing protein n=1 Tax=Steccherinum ochraceum TaxID=92696 RepID=A0A4R0RQB8_9APHY|nr:hypothetical protein EIP91_010894 [Steccherinum ochraceum]